LQFLNSDIKNFYQIGFGHNNHIKGFIEDKKAPNFNLLIKQNDAFIKVKFFVFNNVININFLVVF